MPSSGGDLERSLGALLSLHVPEVEPSRPRSGEVRLGGRQELSSFDVIDDGQQIRRGNDFDLARPGRLTTARGGADDPAAPACRGQCSEQHPGDAGQRPVERQFPENRVRAELVGR